MIQIVIPAAGLGSRFAEAGYDKPKPLIDVLGKPMLQRVIDNIQPSVPSRVQVVSQIELPGISAEVVRVGPTRGAVETILLADIGEGPLLIANCDQLLAFDVNELINLPGDGAIATFRSGKPHHSYVTVADDGFVVEIAEKEVISSHAVSGVYYFKKGSDFVAAAKEVIDQNQLVKGEFYVSTVLKKMLENGAELSILEAPTAILGTPGELQLFEAAAKVAKSL